MNIKEFICALIIFGVFDLIRDLIDNYIVKKQSRKCDYDCLKCKIWDCPGKECLKYRK